MPADNLSDKQPVIAVQLTGELHHLSIVTIRQLAAGYQYQGDKDQLVRVLCSALRDMIDNNP